MSLSQTTIRMMALNLDGDETNPKQLLTKAMSYEGEAGFGEMKQLIELLTKEDENYSIVDSNYKGIVEICKKGNQQKLNYILETIQIPKETIEINGYELLIESCKSGQIEIVKTLMEYFNLDIYNSTEILDIAYNDTIIQENEPNIDMLRYLHETYEAKVPDSSMKNVVETLIKKKEENSYLQKTILTHMVNSSYSLHNNLEKVVNTVVKNSTPEIAEHIFAELCKKYENALSILNLYDLISYAISNGEEMFLWLDSKYKILKYPSEHNGYINTAYHKSLNYGKLCLTKELNKTYKFTDQIKLCDVRRNDPKKENPEEVIMYELIKTSCRSNVETLKWVLKNYPANLIDKVKKFIYSNEFTKLYGCVGDNLIQSVINSNKTEEMVLEYLKLLSEWLNEWEQFNELPKMAYSYELAAKNNLESVANAILYNIIMKHGEDIQCLKQQLLLAACKSDNCKIVDYAIKNMSCVNSLDVLNVAATHFSKLWLFPSKEILEYFIEKFIIKENKFDKDCVYLLINTLYVNGQVDAAKHLYEKYGVKLTPTEASIGRVVQYFAKNTISAQSLNDVIKRTRTMSIDYKEMDYISWTEKLMEELSCKIETELAQLIKETIINKGIDGLEKYKHQLQESEELRREVFNKLLLQPTKNNTVHSTIEFYKTFMNAKEIKNNNYESIKNLCSGYSFNLKDYYNKIYILKWLYNNNKDLRNEETLETYSSMKSSMSIWSCCANSLNKFIEKSRYELGKTH